MAPYQRQVVRHRHHEDGDAGGDEQRDAENLKPHRPEIAQHLDIQHVHHVTSSARIRFGFNSSLTMRPPLNRKHAMSHPCDCGVVSDHGGGRAQFRVDLGNCCKNQPAGVYVERTGRLVAKQDVRPFHDGARHRNALLLSARQLRGKVACAMGQSDEFKRLGGFIGSRAICATSRTFSSTVRLGIRL